VAKSLNIIPSANKADKYRALLPQIKALIQGESDLYANMANTAAALKQTFQFFWVGFYVVKEEELVLGPFQGPVACTRIAKGKGVCGRAWEERKTYIVDDVNAFPGHIACSADSKSEVVVPVVLNQKIIAVLDIDSDQLASFDDTDRKALEEIAGLLSELI